MTPCPGIEPGTYWWEASALTTAPSLLPFGDLLAFYHECRSLIDYDTHYRE